MFVNKYKVTVVGHSMMLGATVEAALAGATSGGGGSTLTWSTLTTSTILTKYLTSSSLQLTLSLTWSTFILSTFGLLLIQNKKNFHTFIYIFTHIQTI